MRKFLLIMMCFLLLSPLCLNGCKDPGYNGTIIIANEPDDTQNSNTNDNSNTSPDNDNPQDSKPDDDNKTSPNNPSDNKPNENTPDENNPDINSPEKPNDDKENVDDQDKEDGEDYFSKDEIDRIVSLVKQTCNKLNYLQGVEPAVALTKENLRIVFFDENFQTEQNAILTPSLIEIFEKENLDVITDLFEGILTICIEKK